MRYSIYKNITEIFEPLIKLWLYIRLWRGKEDKNRFSERLGYSKIPRPKGLVVWLHAASVGEANSVLFLIEQLQTGFPETNILLTTGTVTSAELIKKKNLKNVIHQFVPIDTVRATNRFLYHFRPNVGIWVESELWPNLVINARGRGCFLTIINGRMSEKSYNTWQKYGKATIAQMLECFELIFAQSEGDANRFRSLGAADVRCVGNLKYDAINLACNETDLFALKAQIANRPVWLAASTHAGEEEQLAQAHDLLLKKYPELLTIIVPRHPKRGIEIVDILTKYGKVAMRSKNETISANTSFYIADTLSELGIFYRLCEIVFMGGSLVEKGGQNPIEPIRLRCSVITGLSTENFAEIYSEMEKLQICKKVQNARELAEQIDYLLTNTDILTKNHTIGKEWLKTKGGAVERILNILSPIFTPSILK